MTKVQFWRISKSIANWYRRLPTDLQPLGQIQARTADGVVIGDIDEPSQLILVSHVGVIERILPDEELIQVSWRSAHFVLEPTPQGARYWKDRDNFRFDDLVADRYRLHENFAAAFSDENWQNNRRRFSDE